MYVVATVKLSGIIGYSRIKKVSFIGTIKMSKVTLVYPPKKAKNEKY